MDKKQTAIITALSIVIIVLVFLVSGRIWTRVDLTKNKTWTISPVSKKLADELDDDVRITYFVTDKLKELYGFPGEIEDLIEEFVSFSRGKISFSEKDPAKAGLESRMQELGIPYQEFQLIEKDQASFSNVYTGVLIEYRDKYEVLPFVYRLDTLEYEITNRVRGMVREKENSLGIIISAAQNDFNTDNEYKNVQQALEKAGYKMRVINAGDEIPDTLSGLFVIGGAEEFDDWALYRIDRYIQTGGKVFFTPRAVKLDTTQGLTAKKVGESGLLEMLATYGVRVESELVLDVSANSMPVAQDGWGGFRMAVRYPFHIAARNGNPKQPVTAVFNVLDMYWPSPLTLSAPAGVEAETLFTTTKDAWLQKDNFVLDPQRAQYETGEGSDTKGVYILGAALSGKFPSYWRDKPKPSREGSEELPDMPAGTTPSRIIVIADNDFLVGNIDFVFSRYKQAQNNFDFAVLASNWLSNDDDIIAIRSRAQATPALDKIIDEKERLAAFSVVRVVNTVLVPLIVLALGIFISLRRKKAAALKASEV